PEPVFRGDSRYVECARPECRANNRYSVIDVDFYRTRSYVLNVLELVVSSTTTPLPPLDEVFAAPRARAPLGQGQLILRGPVAVIRNHDNDLNQQVANWWNDNGQPGDAAIG